MAATTGFRSIVVTGRRVWGDANPCSLDSLESGAIKLDLEEDLS